MQAIPIEVNITRENKCGFCTNSKCCTYVTQKIPGPRSRDDFDHLLWQLAHGNVEAYRDSEGWFLTFHTKCLHLGKNGRCAIYETRPQICRDYSNHYCEFDSPAEEGFDLHFKGYESLLKYCKQRFKNWGR